MDNAVLLVLLSIAHSALSLSKNITLTPSTANSSSICPATDVDIDYETDVNSMSLTCEANNASTSRLYDPLTVLGSDPNSTKTLKLSRSTNATVYVSVTASAIRLRVSFVASVELNGTVIKCYSETDSGREDTTTINITGPPQTAPRNLTFNTTNGTLSWEGVPDQDIYYRCTARYSGREIITNVTGGVTMAKHDLGNFSGPVTMEVCAVSCEQDVGPCAVLNVTYTGQAQSLATSTASFNIAVVISVPLLATCICAILITIALCRKSDPRQRLNNGDDGGGGGGGGGSGGGSGGGDGGGGGGSGGGGGGGGGGDGGGGGGGHSRIDTDCDQIDESLGGKTDDYPAPIKSGDAVDKDGIRKRGKPS
ncbi:hypothetical protein EMCRGX_G015524 [Ephydatia muelleri]